MKKLTYLILLLFLSSCSASFHVRKAKQKCPECFKLDTTITETIIRLDTIIHIDTTFIIDFNESLDISEPITIKTEPVKFNNFSSDTVIKTNKGIEAKIWIKNGRINAEITTDTTLTLIYKDSVLLKDAIIRELRTVNINQGITIKETESRIKTIIKWVKITGLIIVILILFGLVLKYIKWIKRK